MKMFSVSDHNDLFSRRCVLVSGPVIVGAGPSGLAVAACLKGQGVPSVVLERADCIASLWQKRTYDRLKLDFPKKFCQLPKLPFPESFPKYPTKKQFINYLESYAEHFEINPQFNECVQSAKYDEACCLWRIRTVSTRDSTQSEVEYICHWLVGATGENAERVMPEIEGLKDFGGEVIHACDYKSGENFSGKKVLVVGCGNSGMELSLDLSNHNAKPSRVVRSSAYVLQEEGKLLELVDPNLGSNYSKEEAKRMLNLSLLCTNPSPTLRPSMSSMDCMIEGNSPVQAPIVKRSSINDDLKFKVFKKSSQDSQTHLSAFSQESQVKESISMDGPWIHSSTSTQSNKNESMDETSSSKLLPDLYDVKLD